MTDQNLPLTSCLCVTRKKVKLLKRAIDCFLHQTYPNKELIVIFEDDDESTRNFFCTLNYNNIQAYEVSSKPKLSLGALRNLSIEKANGEYFCQWDDDDWYHESRIEVQVATVMQSHKPACLLAYWFMFDMVNCRSYLSSIGPWPGSILCRKELVNNRFRYPSLSKHEDYVFMMNLLKGRHAIPLIMPSLYIYTYNGINTFQEDHFKELYQRSQRLPEHISSIFKCIFEDQLSQREASKLLLSHDILHYLDYFHENAYEKEEVTKTIII